MYYLYLSFVFKYSFAWISSKEFLFTIEDIDNKINLIYSYRKIDFYWYTYKHR